MKEPAIADATLVSRMADRDPEAIGSLYDRYRSIVFTLALRVLGDRGEAEEVLMGVFLQAWRLAPAYVSARGTVPGWLLHLCRRRAMERVRSRGGAGPRGSSPGEVAPPQAPATDGSEIHPRLRTRRRRILELLVLLPPDQREAIERAYYGGTTGQGAANGESMEALRGRFCQGLRALRANLTAALP